MRKYKVTVPVLLPLTFEVEIESTDSDTALKEAVDRSTSADHGGEYTDYDGEVIDVSDTGKLLDYDSDLKAEDGYVSVNLVK